MASSSSDRNLNDIPQEFKDLFLWNPPRLRPNPIPGHKLSKKTGDPAFFERHFTEKLKVLHLKRLPSLVHDIAALVDRTIAESPDNFLSFSGSANCFSAAEIYRMTGQLPIGMADEKAVASFYDKSTSVFCLPIASILALRHPRLLLWSQSSNVSGHAIADGYLSFQDLSDLDEKGVQYEESMDEETLNLFRALAEDRVSLLTNEFKNMAAGGPEIMLAIPKLSNEGKFNWTSCEIPDCATSDKHKRMRIKVDKVHLGPDAIDTAWTFDSDDSEHHSLEEMGGRKDLKRKRSDGTSSQNKASHPAPSKGLTVPEMSPPPSGSTRGRQPASSNKTQLPPRTTRQSTRTQIPQTPQAEASVSTKRGKGKAVEKGEKTAQEMPPPPSGNTSGRQPASSTKPQPPRRRTRQSTITQTPQASGLMPLPALPLLSQAEASVSTRKGKEKADVEPDDESDPSYKDQNDLSAQNIVQQAWAQATSVDCSIFVLNSGNHEFICIRHRHTQTLYISELIEPSVCKDPSYGKLHVGLYLAAVKDTMDRKRQVRNAQSLGSGDGPSGSGGGNADSARGGGQGGGEKGDRRDPHSGGEPTGGGQGTQPKQSGSGKPKESGTRRGRSASSTVKKMTMATRDLAAQRTFDIASRRDFILLFLQYGIYDSSNPSTFIRSLPNGQAPNPLPSWETVRNCKLKECLTIVLKSEIGHGATGKVLRGTLEVEASVGCVLLDVAVKLALSSEQRAALRNEYATYHQLRLKAVTSGITAPLGLFYDVHPEGGPSALVMPYAGVPLDEKPGLILPYSHRKAILASLEKIHGADILHGDLCPRNILVADSGLTIIDFSHSRVCDDQDAKKREYLELQSLLNGCAK